MRLTLGKKLGLGFGVILALMVLSVLLSYRKAAEISRSGETAFKQRFSTLENVRNLQRDLNQTMSKGRQAILAGTETTRREEAKKLFEAAWNDIYKDVAKLDLLAPGWALQANRDRLAEVKEQLPKLRQAQEQAMSLAASGDRDAVVRSGNEFADKATVVNEAIKKSVGELADSNDKLLQENEDELSAANNSLVWTMGGNAVAGLAIGTFVATFLSRRISSAT